LNPLVGIFKLLTAVIKPLIPVITFLCNVLAAILLPVVTAINFALSLLIKGFIYLFDAIGNIPFLGDAFKGMNDGLKSFTTGLDTANKNIMFTTDSGALMADQFSKKIDSNPIDGIGKSITTVGDKAKGASEKVKTFLDDALGVQKSFIEATNITGLLNSNTQDVVSSITYVDGKFKTVVASANKSSTDIVSSFKNKLVGIKSFYTDLNKLIAAKLDPELIAQISGAGVEAGGATAKAILDSGKEGISSLNSTFTGIKKIAGDIGFKTAKVMQDTGADIGNGLIDGLAAQSERLNAVAEAMGKDFATSFNKGTKGQDKPKIENVLPKGYSASNVTFVGSRKAMSEGQTSLAPSAYKTIMGRDLRNPFTNLTNPFMPGRKHKGGTFGEVKDWNIANAAKQKAFQKNVDIATKYSIAINVAPGANNAAVGAALVSAIQEYERKTGKVFTK
jgi:hypothetical protein